MSQNLYSTIVGTGSYIPTKCVKNEDFLDHTFFEADGEPLEKNNAYIIQKFEEITTIKERRYVEDNQLTSEIAYEAAVSAIKDAGIDKESLDHIIVAHNFGDVKAGSNRTDMVPSLAARVKFKLGIENPFCVAYDMAFGCPGWLQAVIQADCFIKTRIAKRVLVIGADVLSRISDPHDRDSMIYADGAGATILEGKESSEPIGILAHQTRSDTLEYAKMLYMEKSYKKDYKNPRDIFLKMNGRKLYQYALEKVPQAIYNCLEKSNTPIEKMKKLLIHQANGKMDEAIIKRLYKLYGKREVPEYAMPMSISWMGNSSVATIPTLLDLILKDEMQSHDLSSGDTIVFASVGAGMNINAVTYKLP
jgi:3-oxoacyl-[acyl-carrier-protein] synthase-3